MEMGRAEKVFPEVKGVFDLGADGEAAEDGVLEGRKAVGVTVPELSVFDCPAGFWILAESDGVRGNVPVKGASITENDVDAPCAAWNGR
jgi:hypothetical protein